MIDLRVVDGVVVEVVALVVGLDLLDVLAPLLGVLELLFLGVLLVLLA